MALPIWVNKIEEKCPPINGVINLGRRASMLPEYYRFMCNRFRRRHGAIQEQYSELKKLKDRYKGQRCFIIATGPSLTIDDLELLKNEYTFAVNSACKLYDKTSWRPTFYGIQDRYVFQAMKEYVFNQDESITLFIADVLQEYESIPSRSILFPYNVAYHYINFRKYNSWYAKFSGDSYDTVYDGYSITYSMIEIAVYLGFSEIYLIGADCSYGTGKNHIVESGFVDKKAYLNHERMTAGYKAAKEYAEANNIKIVNCTRGGMLEVFPRMQLEDVLKEKKDENSSNCSYEIE